MVFEEKKSCYRKIELIGGIIIVVTYYALAIINEPTRKVSY